MNPSHLTPEEKDDIIELIMDNPVETVPYSKTIEDERLGYKTTDYFGLIEDANGVHVFAVDPSERDLTFGGTFVDRAKAMEKLCIWALDTQDAAEQVLQDQKERERDRIAFEQSANH